MAYKIGSLFDGSGGFPLAASLCGGTPVWASEVEPYPIAVTKSRFPNMKHLGSVTDVKGNEVEPVDVITFGSPCQDLSVAGKRAGLKHEDNGDEETTRSGLFMEAVRIIKEMREATNGVYPRFAVWENVPGAFSSNKGEDFRTVCEELIKIVEPGAVMPAVPKNGWPYADCYCGDGWSLAYRVYDAQYWGVPQRRRRIYLVLDLGGECAGEVSFEREGLRGYFETCRTPWKAVAGDAEGCPGADDREGAVKAVGFPLGFRPENVRCYDEVATTLCNGTRPGFTTGVIQCVMDAYQHWGWRESNTVGTLTAEQNNHIRGDTPLVCVKHDGCACIGVLASSAVNAEMTDGSISPCLMARAGTGGNQLPLVALGYDARGHGDGNIAPTITGDHNNRVTDYTSIICESVAYCIGNGQVNDAVGTERELCKTLNCMEDTMKICVEFLNEPENYILYIVRRLTPTECARLQGFADAWAVPDSKEDFTDEEYRFWLNVRNTHAEINGKAVKDYTKAQMLIWYNKLHTDSSEYKLWGNGIALPTALYVMQGIADVLNQ